MSCLFLVNNRYFILLIQPSGASISPHCMPVRVSLNVFTTELSLQLFKNSYFLDLSVIAPTGEITAAVPQSPHSTKLSSSVNKTSLSSTCNFKLFRATSTKERLVIDGKMLSDLGTTSFLSFLTKMIFAPPVSSIFVRVFESR